MHKHNSYNNYTDPAVSLGIRLSLTVTKITSAKLGIKVQTLSQRCMQVTRRCLSNSYTVDRLGRIARSPLPVVHGGSPWWWWPSFAAAATFTLLPLWSTENVYVHVVTSLLLFFLLCLLVWGGGRGTWRWARPYKLGAWRSFGRIRVHS